MGRYRRKVKRLLKYRPVETRECFVDALHARQKSLVDIELAGRLVLVVRGVVLARESQKAGQRLPSPTLVKEAADIRDRSYGTACRFLRADELARHGEISCFG